VYVSPKTYKWSGTFIIKDGSYTKVFFIGHVWVTQWCSWLRHCARSWKVTGLIPNGGYWDFTLT
jgi:hypothetical protein